MKISSLISVMAAGRGIATITLYRRLLSGAAMAVALAMLAAMLLGALLVGALYVCYVLLVQSGLEMQAAMLAVGLLALLLTAVAVYAAIVSVRRLLLVPKQLVQIHSPVGSRVNEVAEAFMDGLMGRKASNRR